MNISNFEKCSHCGACYNICPKDAISVRTDGLFYVPEVDVGKCIDCSLCARVCPVNQEFEGRKPISAYGGWHKDSGVVLDSSSGGVFYGLAQAVLEAGGAVFAAVYGNDCKTVEFASSDDIPLQNMLRSKYVESLVGDSFRRVKEALTDGRQVLFCGTPCQVAGLHRYLGREYDSLLTCDFACGGLPSHAIYQAYLNDLEKKYRAPVQSVNFRPKTHGWKRHAIRVEFQNGKEHLRLGSEDPYLNSFLHGKLSVRDYCHECKFPECHASDITVADFWLHEKLSSLRHEDGISLILCNSPKGEQAVKALRNSFELTELNVEKASYNNRVQVSEKKKNKRDAFLLRYEEKGLQAAYDEFLPRSPKVKAKNWVIRKLFRKRKGSS
jgi:coenzyme F420-reducing hydrogenase beta subunit